MKLNLNILLLGDNGVGKSTLISTFISRKFINEVPVVVTDAMIPPESSVNNVCLYIVDSSADEDYRKITKKKIKKADCVIVIYDVTNRNTYDSIMAKWLPMLKKIGNKAVIVVGTKCDLLPNSSEFVNGIRSDEVDILSSFKQVSRCCRISSKQQSLVEYVFRCAELAVNFPIHPLYDMSSQIFTKDCSRAFKRIFRVYDRDNDGLLSDSELNLMQQECFGVKLQPNDIVDVKRKLLKTEGVRGPQHLQNKKITCAGFEKLLSFFMEREHTHALWTILRRFGYEDDLTLENYPEWTRPVDEVSAEDGGCVSVLSPAAASFIVGLTRSVSFTLNGGVEASHESQEYVTQAAIEEVFSVLPPEVRHPWSAGATYRVEGQLFLLPWDRQKQTEPGHIAYKSQQSYRLPLSEWLTHWKTLASRCPELVQTLLFEIGFVDRVDSGVLTRQTLRPGIQLLRSYSSSADFSACNLCVSVAGSRGVGKSALVQLLSGMKGLSSRTEESESLTTVSSRISVRGRRVTDIIWFEQSIAVKADVCDDPESGDYYEVKSILGSDVTVILVDVNSESSIQFALDLDKTLPSNRPRLFVATQADKYRRSATSDSEIESIPLKSLVDYIAENKYLELLWVSGLTGEGVDRLCSTIVQAADRPDSAVPLNSRQRSHELYWMLGIGFSFAVILSSLFVRYQLSPFFIREAKKTK